jgi:hypothetical protein
MKKKVSLKEKIKNISAWIVNILLGLIGITFFAAITALAGKLVNYSPWSLLVVDIIFIFAINKFINKFYYSEIKRKNNFWVYFVVISAVLGLIISIGISLVHSWAILNIIILIFLFFFSLVLFTKRRAKNNLI